MDAPDKVIDAVAEVLWNGDSEPFISWANLSEPVKEMQRDSARRVLAVPAIADALRAAERDAKVTEEIAKIDRGVFEHPCAGSCLGCGAGPDESCGDGCRCDEGDDCLVAALIEAERAPVRRIAALYPEAHR